MLTVTKPIRLIFGRYTAIVLDEVPGPNGRRITEVATLLPVSNRNIAAVGVSFLRNDIERPAQALERTRKHFAKSFPAPKPYYDENYPQA